MDSAMLMVFVSWSGERSAKLGRWIERWFPILVPSVRVYHSGLIPPGVVWFDHIRDYMREADVAVFCIAPDSSQSEWLNFELGLATASGLDFSLVLTLDVEPRDLRGPLGMYLAAPFSKDTVGRFLRHIADKAGFDKLSLDRSLEEQWPRMLEDAQEFLTDGQV